MTAKLVEVMKEFLIRRLGCEGIDDLTLTSAQQGARKADYFHTERNIVIEMKALEGDRVATIATILRQWIQEPDWPKFVGTLDIQEVLKLHPRGRELNNELSLKVAAVVGRHCKDANEQIAATIQSFGLRDPMGVLVLLNDDIDVLEPGVMASALTSAIRPGGAQIRRYAHLDGVIYISWAHLLLDPDDRKRLIACYVAADELDLLQAADSFESYFIKEWAAFLKQPLTDGGTISSPDEFARLSFIGRSEPTTFDVDRLPE